MDLTETFLRRGTGFICYYTGITTSLHQYTLNKIMSYCKVRWVEYAGQFHTEEDILMVFGTLQFSGDWRGITIGIQLTISTEESIDALSRFDYLLVSYLNQLRRLQMILGTMRVMWLPSLIFTERPVADVSRRVLNFDRLKYETVDELIELIRSSKIVITRNDLEDHVAAAMTRPFVSLHNGPLAQELSIEQFYDRLNQHKTKKYVAFLVEAVYRRRTYLEHFNWMALLRTVFKRQFTIGNYDLARYVDLILLHYADQPVLQADLICSKFSGVSGSQYTEAIQTILKKETTHLTSRIVRYLSNQDRKIPLYNLGSGSITDFCGMHRWGWEGVVSLLKPYSGQGGLFLDTYLDRTFHWSYSTLKEVGILPYRFPWIGFFHHTFKDTCAANSRRMFEDPLFQMSLLTCHGLFCLTQELKTEAIQYLRRLNMDIPVHFLYHPTELTVRPFVGSGKLPIVQLGAWYRNTFSIYVVETDHPRLGLRNVKMKNYYPPDHIHLTERDLSTELEQTTPWLFYLCQYIKKHNYLQDILGPKPDRFILDFDITEDITPIDYVSGLQHWLFEKIKSVKVINRLNNFEYDELLSNCIVFIDFVDVAASNSIVECIARGTPLLVPKLPAIVEYLGEDYSLYFDDVTSIQKLLTEKNLSDCKRQLAARRKFVEPSIFLHEFREKLSEL